ncbi:MAG: DUF2752 domain-containing protein [Verrucomicrobia bacterium]|nr:DUF2752 domain-containing protein [Verrucomicrobiota bacterium]MBI3871247.1 DUF2752 domain-containing protein [Verrucomicrobiota bacterium]
MQTVEETEIAPRPRRRLAPRILVACVLASGAITLYCFPPAESGFYPRCVLHQLTGFSCPGCGATRALHHLLHGRLLAAVQSNLLLVAALPWIAVLALRWAARELRGVPRPGLDIGYRGIALALGAMILFGLFRNLPFDVCRWCLPPG